MGAAILVWPPTEPEWTTNITRYLYMVSKFVCVYNHSYNIGVFTLKTLILFLKIQIIVIFILNL